MDWGNAIVREIKKADNGVVQNIVMELHLAGDFKKTEKKITWLASSADAPKLIPASLVDFDYLLTKKKIEENDDWQQYVTPVTEFRKDALIDSNCAALKRGDVIQFERKGYYILDSIEQGGPLSDGSSTDAAGSGRSQMVFFLIPDGKIGTVASKADKSVPAPSAAANTGAAAATPGHKTGRE
jgi:glutamyl-tRNA synthetase